MTETAEAVESPKTYEFVVPLRVPGAGVEPRGIVMIDEHDEMTCRCGNIAAYGGFYECTEDGTILQPSENDAQWEQWNGLWLCGGAACNVIVDNRPRPRKPMVFLKLDAAFHEMYTHLGDSPVWRECGEGTLDQLVAPFGYTAYKHLGCLEVVHIPGITVTSDAKARTVMSICMTEFLADPDATEDDRRALMYHLTGISQVRGTTKWSTDQALAH
ncbi:hypothetical protein, partial [Planotetraspora phitsanulokensis]